MMVVEYGRAWRGLRGHGADLRSLAGDAIDLQSLVRGCANTCNLPEINTAASKIQRRPEARAAATEGATTARTFEPTAAPESDAAAAILRQARWRSLLAPRV